MNPSLLIFLIVTHILCGIVAYGINFAFDTRHWKTIPINFSDLIISFIISITWGSLGIIGLLVTYYTSKRGIHGFSYWYSPLKEKENYWDPFKRRAIAYHCLDELVNTPVLKIPFWIEQNKETLKKLHIKIKKR